MKIRTMLIVSMTVFSLFSMILFTVVVSTFLSGSSGARYKDMMREVSAKQSLSLEVCFNTYEQKVNLIINNPAIADFIAFIEAESVESPYEFDPVNPERRDALSDDQQIKTRALITLGTFMNESSGITGITIYDTRNDPGDNINNYPIITLGSDHRGFLTNAARRNNLEDGQYAAMELANQQFELLRHVQLTEYLYMVCTFSSDDIDMLFVRSRLPTAGKIILICPLNNLLDVAFRGNIDGFMTGSQEYAAITSQFKADETLKRGSAFIKYRIGGSGDFLAYFNEAGDTGWLLGVVAKEDDMYRHSSSARNILLNTTILLGLAMIGLSIFFALKFTKPLIIIKEALAKVRRGDHEVRINITSKTEYKDIANEFNALLDNVVVGEGRYRTVVEMSDNIIFEWNFQTGNVIFSNNFGKKFSYRAPTDSYDDSFLAKCRVHPEDTENYKRTLAKLAKGEEIRQDEFRWKNSFGDYIWMLMRACPIHDSEGNTVKVVGVVIDIDRAKKSEIILSARASYDALTGLYNRSTLEELINNEIELISARKNEFAILFIDVDDFKFFNDNYSHATGDQVLRFTAHSINDIVSKYGMAGRFGGDEFVVCIRNAEINDPAKTAEEILEKLKDGFVCDVGDRLEVRVSIGIAIIKDTTKQVEEIIKMADEAMYKIKKSGKSNYGFIN